MNASISDGGVSMQGYNVFRIDTNEKMRNRA